MNIYLLLNTIKNSLYIPNLLNFFKYLKYKYRKDFRIKYKTSVTGKNKFILNQISKNGYYVEENFLSNDECNKIISYIDNFIKNNPNLVWKDNQDSDNRIHGFEKINFYLNNLCNNKFLLDLSCDYLRNTMSLFMTMANRLIFKSNNVGSGGGWHKDSYSKQFKSIIYLNDVSDENGPFQLVKNSNKIIPTLILFLKLDKNISNTRFENSEILKIINYDSNKIINIKARAGSIIYVDTSLIHRGAPIRLGRRYALTNYYYPLNFLDNHNNHFSPMINKKMF
jgi:hypothetical protein